MNQKYIFEIKFNNFLKIWSKLPIQTALCTLQRKKFTKLKNPYTKSTGL